MGRKGDGKKPGAEAPDDEATVIIPPRRVYGRPADRPLIPAGGGIPAVFRLIALLCVIAVGIAGWFIMREKAAPTDLQIRQGLQAPAKPAIAVQLADEAEIVAHLARETTVFRFESNRRVLVLDFPSLREQGLMLNRAAALVEKAGLPRNRVLRDDELDAAIASAGDTMETYYFGHDYSAVDLARFFALADRDKIALRPQEEWLRGLLRQEGMLSADGRGALISVPSAGTGQAVDQALRAAILRHELSHAEYFSNAIYAGYARQFWQQGLDEAGRQAFRRYLAAQNYDPALEDLTINEMQAYLMHTTDPRLFSAAALGVAPETIDRWQAAFLLGMPNGWLRDACLAALPSAGAVLSRPRRRCRRQRQRGSVPTRMARALTRAPRRTADSSAA